MPRSVKRQLIKDILRLQAEGKRIKEITVNARTWRALDTVDSVSCQTTFLTICGVPIRKLPFQYSRIRYELFT